MSECITIPVVDLKRENRFEADFVMAFQRVLKSGQYILGDELAQLELELAKYFGVGYAVGVNSGTSALHLALILAGVTIGTEVITTTLTFAATGLAIKYVGAKPRFVDVDPTTWNMDVEQVEASVNERTRAVVAVHLHGRPCEMDRLAAICKKHELTLIEDAAHAHGALFNGQHAGSFGDMAAFSFYPTKVLGAIGQGGAVLTNSASTAEQARLLRSYGTCDGVNYLSTGFNYRLDEIQSAVLRVKLAKIESYLQARRRIAKTYSDRLSCEGIVIPAPEGSAKHAFYVYSIRNKFRDQLRSFLAERGIQTGVHYATPLHGLTPFREYGYTKGQFPIAEQCADEFLSLPLYPSMVNSAVETVVDSVQRRAAQHSS